MQDQSIKPMSHSETSLTENKRKIIFGDFVYYSVNQELWFKDRLCQLEPKMLQLIGLLIDARPKVVDKEELMNKLWPDASVSDWSLARLVSDTRKLIEDDGKQQKIIKTVRGKGFAFISEADEIIEYPKNETDQQQSRNTMGIKPLRLSALAKKGRLLPGIFLIVAVMVSWSVYQMFEASPTVREPIAQKIDHTTEGHVFELMSNIQQNMNLTLVAHSAQQRRRDELREMLISRFPESVDYGSEEIFQKYYQKLTPAEEFIFHQIRALTEGPLYQGNRDNLNLLKLHPELYQEIKDLNKLYQHLNLWVNKYERVFKVREDMCLVYVGEEDGVPYPKKVDGDIEAWLKRYNIRQTLEIKTDNLH